MDSVGLFFFLVLSTPLILICGEAQSDVVTSKGDKALTCDNGKEHISQDMGTKSNWECQIKGGFPLKNEYMMLPIPTCNRTHFAPTFHCMDTPLHYSEHPPLVGDYRPVAPQYGEYSYLPPQRWLHALRLGAVAFLYHPCAPPEQVQALKELVRSCLWKHVFTPYPHLTQEKPLALVSWGCMYNMEWVDPQSVRTWLTQNALQTDESSQLTEGSYNEGLVHNSDSNLPPNSICQPPDTPHTPLTNLTPSQEPSPCPNNSSHSEPDCTGPTTFVVVTESHRLQVLLALAIIILLLAILLILCRVWSSCTVRGRVKGKYKLVSKYFPVAVERGGDGMAIPEMGIPKDGLSEREKLLEESDEDEL